MAIKGSFAHILTSQFLQLHYTEIGKSSEEIGIEVGSSGRTVRNYLRLHAISFSEAMRLRNKPNSGSFKKGHPATETSFQPGMTPLHKGKTKENCLAAAKISIAKRGKKRPNMSGPLHPNWKGDAVSEAMRVRGSPAYKAWRSAVFCETIFTCQECDKRGGRLEAHHIKQFALHKDKRLEVENGKTLCVGCHRAFPHWKQPKTPAGAATVTWQ